MKNMKVRALAGLLCASMLFTSNGITSLAAGVDMDQVVSDEAAPEDDTVTDEVTDSDDADPDADQDTDGADGEESADDTDEDAAEDEAGDTEDTDSEESAADETDITEDETEDPELIDPEAAEETLEDAEDDAAALGVVNDYLTVDEDGTLEVITGQDLKNATAVTIPDECVTIPEGFFKDYPNITSIYISTGSGNSSLETIGKSAFAGTGIKSIYIPEGVKTIPEKAFEDCASLEQVSNASHVTQIKAYAFYGCSALAGIQLNSAEYIGIGAFKDCAALSTAATGNVQIIGAEAFNGCTSLSRVTLGGSVTSIGDCAFKNSGLTSVDMGSITAEATLGYELFENCTKLTTMVFSGNQTRIPTKTFMGCTKLSSVTINAGVETIGTYAFSDCKMLKTISFPWTVYSFEAYALKNCTSLSEVYIRYPEDGISDCALDIDENAFPAVTGTVTVYGYNSGVKDFADRTTNYEYETLSEKHTVTGTVTNSKYGTIAVSPASAVKGEIITVTATPAENYSIKTGNITYKADGVTSTPVYTSSTDKEIIYQFTMPDANTEVSVTFSKLSNAAYGSLSDYSLESDDGAYLNKSENTAYFYKSGTAAKLIVNDSTNDTSGSDIVGSWLLNYSSSNSKVAKIDINGNITALTSGTAKITAALKSDSTKYVSFNVVVQAVPVIKTLKLDYSSRPSTVKLLTDSSTDLDVLLIPKSYVAKNSLKVTLGVKAYELDEEDVKTSSSTYITTTKWTAVDTSIVSVPSTLYSKTAEITLKAGAEGETLVTVTTENKNTDDENYKKITYHFLIRVVDTTPRLVDTKVSVNYDSTIGTPVTINEVYDYAIDTGSLYVQKLNSSKAYETVAGVGYRYNSGSYYVYATQALGLEQGKSVTYKGSGQLYLSGKYTNGAEFHIPVPELTVTRADLKPTVKTSGKINLFYNSTATSAEQGTVLCTQSLTKETLSAAFLDTESTYAKTQVEHTNGLAQNFDVDIVNNNVVISRSDNETLATSGGKTVTSGYLYLKYSGYKSYIPVKISIPTCNTTPSLALSTSTFTTNTRLQNQSFSIAIYDKTAKKNLDLGKLLYDTDSSKYGLKLDDLSTTNGAFQSLGKSATEAAIEDGEYFCLQVDGKPVKSKAVINVQMEGWNSPVKFTVNVNVTDKIPVAKADTASVTLNNLLPSQEGKITLKLDQTEASFCDGSESKPTYSFSTLTPVYTGNAKQKTEADKLTFDLGLTTGADGVKVGTITAGMSDTVAKGTYSFSLTPYAKYVYTDGNGTAKETIVSLKAVSFKVVVNGSTPVIKLKSGTLTLNAKVPGRETASTTFTLNNLPAGVDYILDDDDVEITSSQAGQELFDNDDVLFDFNTESGKITVGFSEDLSVAKAFSYKYTVTGLKVDPDNGDDPIEIAPFSITVKGTYADPAVQVKSSGTLNTIEPDSVISYVTTVKNIVSDVSDVEIWEIDTTDNRNEYIYDDDNNHCSTHFEIVSSSVSADGKTFSITAKTTDSDTGAKAELDSKVKYKFVLAYKLAYGDPDKWVLSSTISVQPKQTFPKLKVTADKNYIYAGQAIANRIVTVDVAKTTVTGSTIEGIDWAKGTSDAVKSAFDLEWDIENSQLTVKLRNPGALVAGKKYTLSFVTEYDNQLANTTGTGFSIPVTIKK